MQLSALESEVFEGLKKSGLSVFRAEDICLLFGFDKTKAYNVVKSLKKKGAISVVRAGLFSLKGTSEFVIGAHLNWPSYLSFWSALNYYGFSDQLPKTVFFSSTKHRKKTKGFTFITLSKKRFFGYASVGDIVIAEKEKVFVDCLLFPKYSGGIREIFGSLKAGLNQLDEKKLVNYALRMNSKAVIRRLGFLLEQTGKKERLEKLRKHIGKGFELLDPSLKRTTIFDKKWLLNINW